MCITYAVTRAVKRKQEREKAEEAADVQHKIQAQLGPRPITPPQAAAAQHQQHNVTAPMPQRYSPRHSTSPLSPDNTHFTSPTEPQGPGSSQQPVELDSPVSAATVGNRMSMDPPPARHPGHNAHGFARMQGGYDSHTNPYGPDSFGRPPNPALGEGPPSYSYSERTDGRSRQSEARGYGYGMMGAA